MATVRGTRCHTCELFEQEAVTLADGSPVLETLRDRAAALRDKVDALAKCGLRPEILEETDALAEDVEHLVKLLRDR
jgi:hypothetical protein